MGYGGWEKLESIGSGGQSEVFLARSPLRVEERTKCMTAIKRGGYDEQQIPLHYQYARPDTLLEQGALKIFKQRDNSIEPVARLKREIEILREKRPNLPRLLDAN